MTAATFSNAEWQLPDNLRGTRLDVEFHAALVKTQNMLMCLGVKPIRITKVMRIGLCLFVLLFDFVVCSPSSSFVRSWRQKGC